MSAASQTIDHEKGDDFIKANGVRWGKLLTKHLAAGLPWNDPRVQNVLADWQARLDRQRNFDATVRAIRVGDGATFLGSRRFPERLPFINARPTPGTEAVSLISMFDFHPTERTLFPTHNRKGKTFFFKRGSIEKIARAYPAGELVSLSTRLALGWPMTPEAAARAKQERVVEKIQATTGAASSSTSIPSPAAGVPTIAGTASDPPAPAAAGIQLTPTQGVDPMGLDSILGGLTGIADSVAATVNSVTAPLMQASSAVNQVKNTVATFGKSQPPVLMAQQASATSPFVGGQVIQAQPAMGVVGPLALGTAGALLPSLLPNLTGPGSITDAPFFDVVSDNEGFRSTKAGNLVPTEIQKTMPNGEEGTWVFAGKPTAYSKIGTYPKKKRHSHAHTHRRRTRKR